VLAVMLGISAFFLLVMTVPAPPFERLSPIPADGAASTRCWKTRDDHPPVALPASPASRCLASRWPRSSSAHRRRVDHDHPALDHLAWYFLSLGLLIALVELSRAGLGGYWAWDPWRTRPSALAHRHRVPALGDDPGAAADAESSGT